jgi:hypothetical protein
MRKRSGASPRALLRGAAQRYGTRDGMRVVAHERFANERTSGSAARYAMREREAPFTAVQSKARLSAPDEVCRRELFADAAPRRYAPRCYSAAAR